MYYAKFIVKETGECFEIVSLEVHAPGDVKTALEAMGIPDLRDQCYKHLQSLSIPKRQKIVVETRKHAISEVSPDKFWARFITTKSKARKGKPKGDSGVA